MSARKTRRMAFRVSMSSSLGLDECSVYCATFSILMLVNVMFKEMR